jgi:hypothetical protein
MADVLVCHERLVHGDVHQPQNIASGSDRPLEGFTFGLGPVTFRIGKHEKLLNYEDNRLTIWHNAVGVAGVAMGKGHIGWDWGSLSPVYKGGFASLLDKMGYSGYGAHAIFVSDDASILEESCAWRTSSSAMKGWCTGTYTNHKIFLESLASKWPEYYPYQELWHWAYYHQGMLHGQSVVY